MNYKVVKLKDYKTKYKNQGLTQNNVGILLSQKEEYFQVLFFNARNEGDYLVSLVDKNDVEYIEEDLQESITVEFDRYVKNNLEKIQNKQNFIMNPFNECDFVELIVEKEQYKKLGLKKGDRGVIALNKATKDKVLVEFDIETDKTDGFVLVNFEDVKKV